MKVLLIGSTGMLGQAIYNKCKYEKINVVTIARSNCDYNIDLSINPEKIMSVINIEMPDIIINTAALINIQECEDHPEIAYLINSRIPALIAETCKQKGIFFVQISTDHYYINDDKYNHNEKDPIFLINEYARTKYAGEAFALTYYNSLVVRTNIVGFRNKKYKPTFVEWVFRSLQNEQVITGYEDFFTSSIDVYHFSDILFELIMQRITGLINVGSEDILSKYEFICRIAILLKKERYVIKGKLEQSIGVRRANSLGLDTAKLKGILIKETIPSSNNVIQKLFDKYNEGVFYEL